MRVCYYPAAIVSLLVYIMNFKRKKERKRRKRKLIDDKSPQFS